MTSNSILYFDPEEGFSLHAYDEIGNVSFPWGSEVEVSLPGAYARAWKDGFTPTQWVRKGGYVSDIPSGVTGAWSRLIAQSLNPPNIPMLFTEDTTFNDHKSFAAYLQSRGWIAEGHENDVLNAAAAFEMNQRRQGIENARKAMNKACDKAR